MQNKLLMRMMEITTIIKHALQKHISIATHHIHYHQKFPSSSSSSHHHRNHQIGVTRTHDSNVFCDCIYPINLLECRKVSVGDWSTLVVKTNITPKVYSQVLEKDHVYVYTNVENNRVMQEIAHMCLWLKYSHSIAWRVRRVSPNQCRGTNESVSAWVMKNGLGRIQCVWVGRNYIRCFMSANSHSESIMCLCKLASISFWRKSEIHIASVSYR